MRFMSLFAIPSRQHVILEVSQSGHVCTSIADHQILGRPRRAASSRKKAGSIKRDRSL